jgi:predicted PurR-regulated permease PerM
MTFQQGRIEQVAGIVILGVLLIGVFVVLRPFVAVLLWALILAMATWPAYQFLKRRLGGRESLAATTMTLILLTVLVVPLVAVGFSLSENLTAATAKMRDLAATGLPPMPTWVETIPLFGDGIAERWQALTEPAALQEAFRQNVRPVVQWALSALGGIGGALGQMTLSIILAWFFYKDGMAAAERLGNVLKRVAGERSERILTTAGSTLKGVVYGLVGTAIAQGTLATIGYTVAGIPHALLLGVITAFLSPFPFGVLLPALPALYWLFSTGDTVWAVALLLWSLIVVGGAENIIKPIFIGRGSNLPLILVFIGILGGAIAFGFLGLFIGPTLLAIAYGLLRDWAPSEPELNGMQSAADPPPKTG